MHLAMPWHPVVPSPGCWGSISVLGDQPLALLAEREEEHLCKLVSWFQTNGARAETLLVSASWLCAAQHNPYTKVTCFGVVYQLVKTGVKEVVEQNVAGYIAWIQSSLLLLGSVKFSLKIYFKRQSSKENANILLFAGSLPQMVVKARAGSGQSETRNPIMVYHLGDSNPRTWVVIFWCTSSEKQMGSIARAWSRHCSMGWAIPSRGFT